MKSFRTITHTADLKISAEASTLVELFEISFIALNEQLKKNFCQKIKSFPVSKKISISSVDKTTLLIDFLSEVLTLSQINQIIFCQVRFDEFTEKELLATLYGAKVENFDEDIKAVTYHDAKIIENQKGYFETNIVFDI